MSTFPVRSLHATWLGLVLMTAASVPSAATLPTAWSARGIGAGGALMDPSFSPHDARLFVACDMSELFRSEDLGRHWQTVSFAQIQGNRGTRVGFTSLPDRLYAIDQTGELPVPAVSNDGGLTWARVSTAAWPEDRTAYALFVDGAGSQRLLVSSDDTLWISNDGGASFQQRYTTASGNGLYLAGAFFDGSSIRVGSSDGLLVSSNGGTSFALQAMPGFPADSGMISFAGAREGGQVRLFASAAARADLYPGILVEELFGNAFRGLWRLDPGQGSWSAATAGIDLDDRPILVGMAGNDIDTLYAAGALDPNQGEAPVVYRSLNGGAGFSAVLNIDGNQNIATGWAGAGGDRGWSYGGGLIGFAVAPNNAQRLAISDYGFVHVSEDGGAHWRQGYVDAATQNPENANTPAGHSYRSVGIENTSVWSLAWSDATHLFAGFSDIRAIRSVDAGLSWSFDYSGHSQNSMYRVVRHADGSLYGATSTAHDLYQSTYLQDARIDGAGGRLLRSSNHGQTWTLVHDFLHALAWVALDPNNAQRAYVAVAHSVDGGVWVTENLQLGAASTWARLPSPVRTEGHAYNIVVLNDGGIVASYSGRRTAAGVFTASSGVYYKASPAAPWQDRSAAGMQYWTKDVVVDPHDATQNTWYAAVFSGWGGPASGQGGLYRSSNRGQSWTRISALDRVESITLHPLDPTLAYVTTEMDGLWTSRNINAPAPIFQRDPAYPFRQPVRVFFNPHDADEVWVSSFGGGLRVGRAVPIGEAPVFRDGFEDSPGP